MKNRLVCFLLLATFGVAGVVFADCATAATPYQYWGSFVGCQPYQCGDECRTDICCDNGGQNQNTQSTCVQLGDCYNNYYNEIVLNCPSGNP
jgi:hypothetical protein